jgi:peroxiredoxin
MMWLRYPVTGVVLSIALLLAACDSSNESTTASTDVAADKTVAGVGQARPAFSLPDNHDRVRHIADWDGKVLVINFWATWCPPCRREMPMFVEMQEQFRQQGLQFVGVAIDDADKVQDFMDTVGVNYPMLIGGGDAIAIAKQYGNRFGALPYSVIIDRDGVIRFIQRGELRPEVLKEQLAPLL